MEYEAEISIDPSELDDQHLIKERLCIQAGISPADLTGMHLERRSIDSRKNPIYRLKYKLYDGGDRYVSPPFLRDKYRDVTNSNEVVIIGAGPAGYFAALQCLEDGLKPIVLDRGKDAQSRRRDLRAIQQHGIVHPDSNYCFGEGGAGTYSDGKLYTRSKKRGSVEVVLRTFVEHGADPQILVDAHPHIGSNKLPHIIANIRKTILDFGGEVHFNHRVIDFDIKDAVLRGVKTSQGMIFGDRFILATGHSARDIYRLLQYHDIEFEAKPFALGVRVEHPQSFVDLRQYKQRPRHPNLPPAAYRLACQTHNRGVFSFCMCPGGLIVPAATAPGEIVVNGMSLSRRDSPFANAGIVVAVSVADVRKLGYDGALGCLNYQADVESKMFASGDGSQKAPAQRVIDFLNGVRSSEIGPSSYIPGLHAQRLDLLLPPEISENLRKGFTIFNSKMPGFANEDAILVGVESRTSAPVRIPRGIEHCMHPGIKGLYPCGEGAGYAGGIVSAALDGQKVAAAIAVTKK